MKILSKLSFLLAVFFSIPAFAASDSAFGLWLTQDRDAAVRVGPCRDKPQALCGILEKVFEAGSVSKIDAANTKRLKGTRILSNFSRNDAGWGGGNAYDPEEKKTYSDISLTVTGQGTIEIKKTLAGMTLDKQTWTRLAP